MKKFTFIMYAAAAVLCLSGCSLLSPAINTVNYYDIDFKGEKPFETDYRFSFRNFQNISPARMNFLYTWENSVMELDQYNCWIQSPEVMLRRYMLAAVRSSNNADARQFDVALTIFEFKFDVVRKKAVLGINCVLRESADNKKFEKNYIIETPIENVGRAAFVNGMNQCVEKFVQTAIDDIKKL